MDTKWVNLIFILGGPFLTPLIHVFFGTFEKIGTIGIIQEIGMAAGVSLFVSWVMFKVFRKSPFSSIIASIVVAFILVELFTFLPKIPDMTPEDRMWLPVALLFYPLQVSPTVIGICIGVTNLLKTLESKSRVKETE